MKKIILLTFLLMSTICFGQRYNYDRSDTLSLNGVQKHLTISNLLAGENDLGVKTNMAGAYATAGSYSWIAVDTVKKFADSNAVFFTLGAKNSLSSVSAKIHVGRGTNKDASLDTLYSGINLNCASRTNDTMAIYLVRRESGRTSEQTYASYYYPMTVNDTIMIKQHVDTTTCRVRRVGSDWVQIFKTTLTNIRGSRTDWNLWYALKTPTSGTALQLDNLFLGTTAGGSGSPPPAGETDTVDPSISSITLRPTAYPDTSTDTYFTATVSDNYGVAKWVLKINGSSVDSATYAGGVLSQSITTLTTKFGTTGYKTYQFVVTDDSARTTTTALDSFQVRERITTSFKSVAYVVSWELNMGSGTNGNYGRLPYQNIDMNAYTDFIMFALAPTVDGGIVYNNLVTSRQKPFNDYVHSFGKPISICIGGSTASAQFWLTEASRTTMVRNLMIVLRTQEYDGIDLDPEPFNNVDTTTYKLFCLELYDSLQNAHAYYDVSKKPLLTAAIGYSRMWTGLESIFDRFNMMTYDLSTSLGFASTDYHAWHNNAPYMPLPNSGTNLNYTAIQTRWERQMGYGSTPSKYLMGIDCNGVIETGVLNPKDAWVGTRRIQIDVNYNNNLYAQYIDTATSWSKRWDDTAKAPYLSINSSIHDSLDMFISYQDSLGVKAIVDYAIAAGAGGVLLWDKGEDYLASTYSVRNPFDIWISAAISGIVEPPDTGYPAAPTLATPANNATAQDTALAFTWSSVSGATKYWFQVSTDSSFITSHTSDSTLVTTTKSINGLAKTTVYYWRVATKNVTGWGSFSEFFKFTTVYNTVTVPVLVAPTANATSQTVPLAFRWNNIPTATTYQIIITADTSGSINIADQSLTDTAYTHLSSLTYSTPYWWKVRSMNTLDTSAYCGWRKFTYQTAPVVIPSEVGTILKENPSGKKSSVSMDFFESIPFCLPSSISVTNLDTVKIRLFVNSSNGKLQYKKRISMTDEVGTVYNIDGTLP